MIQPKEDKEFSKVTLPMPVYGMWDHALNCECTTWTRAWYQMASFHHPRCPKYDEEN